MLRNGVAHLSGETNCVGTHKQQNFVGVLFHSVWYVGTPLQLETSGFERVEGVNRPLHELNSLVPQR